MNRADATRAGRDIVAQWTKEGRPGAEGLYYVLRHGGRGSDRWRVLGAAKTPESGRAQWGNAMSHAWQGGVALWFGGGELVEYYEAPLLRRRW